MRLVVSSLSLAFVGAAFLSAESANDRLEKAGALAKQYVKTGELTKAAAACEEAAKIAQEIGELEKAAKGWNCSGGFLQTVGKYRQALSAYNESLRIARQMGNQEMVGAILINLSSLYTFLWEPDAAEMAVAEASRVIAPNSIYGPQLSLQWSQVRAKARDFPEARRHAIEGIERASLVNNRQMESRGWEKLGWILLASRNNRGAEAAFTEAFRIAKLAKVPIMPAIYQGLARVRLAQGRPLEAIVLMDEALRTARTGAAQAVWTLHHARGRAREAAGQLPLALDDFRESLRQARLWRQEVLPSMQTSVDLGLATVSSDFVLLADRLAVNSGRRPDETLELEAFLETEQGKAASLQNLLIAGSRIPENLMNAYAETVQKLREALVVSLRAGGKQETPELTQLRAQLAVIEAQAIPSGAARYGPGRGSPAQKLEDLRESLAPTEALFSFHVDESSTRLWVVTRDSFHRILLPGRGALRSLIEAETRALVKVAGSQKVLPGLSTALLGPLPADVLKRTHWILSLDETLFGVPWPALTKDSPTGPRYLVEDHSFQIVPSAQMLLDRGTTRPNPPGAIVAVGDPVYNRADPRWTPVPAARTQKSSSWFRTAAEATVTSPVVLELPRLVATAKEVETVFSMSGATGDRRVSLTGAQASLSELQKALAKPIEILHFATHVITSPQRRGAVLVSPEIESPDAERGFSAQRPSEILIALALDPQGNLNFLSTSEILAATFQLPNALVVLDGCSSGQGEVWPGAGLLGMSRAWLTTGARTVVVSHWPAPDDSGALFGAFYQEVTRSAPREFVSSAMALRSAQLAMLRSGTWRAHPKFWASYFVVGRE